MNDRCEQLHAYVDGELETHERLAYETHLAACEACATELPRLLALVAVLDGTALPFGSAAGRVHAPAGDGTALPFGSAAGRVHAPAGDGTALPFGSAAGRVHAPAGEGAMTAEGTKAPRLRLVTDPTSSPASAAPAPRRRTSRRPLWVASGTITLAAMAAGVALFVWPPRPPPTEVASLDSELAPTRSLEPRLSYRGAERHRPLNVARGARSNEAITMERMSKLESTKNWHGVAVAALLAGERDRAERFFAQAPATPDVDSDRAALELLDGSPAALERALDYVDRALAAAPNNTAAQWNRALVLAGLNLPLAAASDFDRMAASNEPGWADEARMRAAALRAEVVRRRARWKTANDAGPRLIQDGTPVPEDALAITGYMTIMLYDAVRAAPSRARVEALLPLAKSLDAAYRSDRLTAYVVRIAAADFRVRKPLADTYRELVAKGELPDAAVDGFLKRLDQTGTIDIWMGAVVRTGRVAAHLDEYRRRAAAMDPWFALIAEHETAKVEIARGEHAAAERRLRDAIAVARRERLGYRAILLEEQLTTLLRVTRRLSQAATEAQLGHRDAIAGGDALREFNALSELAAINQQRYANGLARAYVSELIERSTSSVRSGDSAAEEEFDCNSRRYALQSLANISLLMLDPDRARSAMAAAPQCSNALSARVGPSLQRALMLNDALVWTAMSRLTQRTEDAQRARYSIAALRGLPPGSPGDEAIAATAAGDRLIEDDRAAGQRLLRDAIARAGHQTDGESVRARAYSYSLLALDAGKASEFANVLRVVADNLEVAVPERCALAIAVQDDRSVVAFSDAGGKTGGEYRAGLKSAILDAAALVPPTIVERLRACDRVVVLSRAPVLGAARLLPLDVAWSYLLGGMRGNSAPPGNGRLVVANPEAPAALNLPALGPYTEDARDGTTILRGKDATPTRVLQAMREAGIIELHTHGFIANDVSEASYLVLSPELDGQYALTADDVAHIKLDATPLVILGACYAATSSRTLEGGMGLAEAFLRSGARAVIASPDAVQDLDAPGFFAAVRERVMKGVAPAIAVRDERVRRLSTARDDAWISSVVVFE